MTDITDEIVTKAVQVFDSADINGGCLFDWMRAALEAAAPLIMAEKETAPDIKPIVEALDKICKIQRATYGNATALHIAMDGVAENANAAIDAYRKSTTGE